MGQIADDIMDGFQCSHCGICFDGTHGFPVLCRDCYADDQKDGRPTGIPLATLKELGDVDEEEAASKKDRRAAASAALEDLHRRASEAGLQLKQCNEAHYQLFNVKPRTWLQNIYPGNRRLYYDRNQPVKPPFIGDLPAEWTLGDVVEQTINALSPKGA